MRFSQRIGKTEVQTTIQKDTMSDSFKNRLNNLIDDIHGRIDNSHHYRNFDEKCCNHFGWRFTEAFKHNGALGYLRFNHTSNVMFLYDMVEFLVLYWRTIEQRHNVIIKSIEVIKRFNNIFELEKSAYRLDGNGQLIPIIDEMELKELNKGNNSSRPYPNVYEHLKKARNFFSDREQADYDKAIVESIHAIEEICRIITDDEKATLAIALKNMELHKALEDSLTKLYGFSSDTVRHAKKSDHVKIDENDARLILITSHSIVNYLISKNL